MPRPAVKRRHNLPAHRLRLIGREQDLLVVRHALLDTEGRLLTLTGTGGCGKTRLALEHAATDDLVRAPAVQLFLERAQASTPTFVSDAHLATIGDICRRLNGLPLAIELAAARVRTLGVDQILERLDDSIHLLVGGSRTAPSRQQTLYATLGWSYDLLGERERAVFRRLAMFAESFSLDAAEAVCADSNVASSDVLDELQ